MIGVGETGAVAHQRAIGWVTEESHVMALQPFWDRKMRMYPPAKLFIAGEFIRTKSDMRVQRIETHRPSSSSLMKNHLMRAVWGSEGIVSKRIGSRYVTALKASERVGATLTARSVAEPRMVEDEEPEFRAAVMASALMRIRAASARKGPDTMSSIWGPGGIECGRKALSRNANCVD